MPLEILLGMVVSGILLLGYYAMDRIDKSTECGGSEHNPETHPKDAVLVFGVGYSIEKLIQQLAYVNITSETTSEPSIMELSRFNVVLALSANDLDNLLLWMKSC